MSRSPLLAQESVPSATGTPAAWKAARSNGARAKYAWLPGQCTTDTPRPASASTSPGEGQLPWTSSAPSRSPAASSRAAPDVRGEGPSQAENGPSPRSIQAVSSGVSAQWMATGRAPRSAATSASSASPTVWTPWGENPDARRSPSPRASAARAAASASSVRPSRPSGEPSMTSRSATSRSGLPSSMAATSPVASMSRTVVVPVESRRSAERRAPPATSCSESEARRWSTSPTQPRKPPSPTGSPRAAPRSRWAWAFTNPGARTVARASGSTSTGPRTATTRPSSSSTSASKRTSSADTTTAPARRVRGQSASAGAAVKAS